ncbi:MAG: hypothetical protein JWN34_1115 [Bryobacterales bacterium]|nr:hypothetical protein [Bryobacterales bacterium]
MSDTPAWCHMCHTGARKIRRSLRYVPKEIHIGSAYPRSSPAIQHRNRSHHYEPRSATVHVSGPIYDSRRTAKCLPIGLVMSAYHRLRTIGSQTPKQGHYPQPPFPGQTCRAAEFPREGGKTVVGFKKEPASTFRRPEALSSIFDLASAHRLRASNVAPNGRDGRPSSNACRCETAARMGRFVSMDTNSSAGRVRASAPAGENVHTVATRGLLASMSDEPLRGSGLTRSSQSRAPCTTRRLWIYSQLG